MKSNQLTQSELETLIGRYFNADTTEEEEEILRHALATGAYQSSQAVGEALALMSLTSTSRKVTKSRHRFTYLRHAAAILIVAALGVVWLMNFNQPNVCETYIAGTKIEEKQMVMSIISNDLACMSEAAEYFAPDIDAQFDDISKLLEN